MNKKSVSEIIDAPIDDVWWVLQDTMDSTIKGEFKVMDRVSGGDERCLLYTSPSPRDLSTSRMPSSA